MEIKEIIEQVEDIRAKGLEYDQALALINLTIELNKVYQVIGDIVALALKDADKATADRKTNSASEYLKSKTSAEKVTDKFAEAEADKAIALDRYAEATTRSYSEQVSNLRETVSELVMSLKKKADIISSLANMGA
jgi:hypothetical protein